MVPGFILPEITAQESGSGPAVDVSTASGRILQLTLGITRSVEQESLEIAIFGSPDGVEWKKQPIATFPQKFYCGTYTIMVDLSRDPNIRFIRAQWKMNRWGRGSLKPLFSFYIFAESRKPLAVGATA
jgi:hypothetical protein